MGISEITAKGEEYAKLTFNSLDKFKDGIKIYLRNFGWIIIYESYIYVKKQNSWE